MDWVFIDDRRICQQIIDQLTLRISAGKYLPGECLPSIRELAAQMGVSPSTMQRAMAQLQTDGLIVGSRTTVRSVTKDVSIIEAATKVCAKVAVTRCLRGLQELGYSAEDVLMFVKESCTQNPQDQVTNII